MIPELFTELYGKFMLIVKADLYFVAHEANLIEMVLTRWSYNDSWFFVLHFQWT